MRSEEEKEVIQFQEGASSIRCLVVGVVHNQRGAATFALAAFPYVTLIVLCHLFL